MANEKFNWNNLPWTPIILVGGGLFFGKKILDYFGIGKDKADQTVETNAIAPYWSGSYYRGFYNTGHKVYLLTQQQQKDYAKAIYDSKGFVNDDEEKVTGVFRSLHYKTQVSLLSEYFYQTYKKDLYGYLNSFLDNDKEFLPIIKIIDALPVGSE